VLPGEPAPSIQLLLTRALSLRAREENVTHDDVAFIFKRYSFCTRLRDPPPPEPEVRVCGRACLPAARCPLPASPSVTRETIVVMARRPCRSTLRAPPHGCRISCACARDPLTARLTMSALVNVRMCMGCRWRRRPRFGSVSRRWVLRQVNDMVRELFKQLKVLSDAHSVAQRKLDAILAGQHM